MPTISKWTLAYRLFSQPRSWEWQDSNRKSYHGYFRAISPEDGSGSSFNLTIALRGGAGETVTFHIRTFD